MERVEKVQDPIGTLLEKGYEKHKIFSRRDCLDYDCGFGIFTGEFGENCDGVTLKFTDGKEFLSDFCTLQENNSPSLMWDITNEIKRVRVEMEENLTGMIAEYESL